MNYIGIDQGMTGAIALVAGDGTLMECWEIPTFEKGGGARGNEYDLPALVDLFHYEVLGAYGGPTECFVITENVMFVPHGSKAPAFAHMKLARSQGLWEGMFATTRVRYELVMPQTWKKTFHITGGGDEAKEKSRQEALRLWGGSDWFRRKSDHNRAEAALMAEHRRRIG